MFTLPHKIAQRKNIIKCDLTHAFYQIPLSKASIKYCGVATPSSNIRVYTRSAVGMPGSMTLLEELMCRVLGDFPQEGCTAKLAEDLYGGSDTPQELITKWSRILRTLARCNLQMSTTKTVIWPKITIISCWIWSQGSSWKFSLHCSTRNLPSSWDNKRSAFLHWCLQSPKPCPSSLLSTCGSTWIILGQSATGNHAKWDESLRQKFTTAQDFLNLNKSIVLPHASEQLWIVTDGSERKSNGKTFHQRHNGLKTCPINRSAFS